MRYLCSGPETGLTYSLAGRTRFEKVRIDLKRMRIIRDDFTFATTDPNGKQIELGYAGDCWSMNYGPCRRGHFKINLSGTGLRIRSSVHWRNAGFPPGMEMREYRKSEDGTVVFAKCGGWCGYCKPTGDLFVQQQVCNQVFGKFVIGQSVNLV